MEKHTASLVAISLLGLAFLFLGTKAEATFCGVGWSNAPACRQSLANYIGGGPAPWMLRNRAMGQFPVVGINPHSPMIYNGYFPLSTGPMLGPTAATPGACSGVSGIGSFGAEAACRSRMGRGGFRGF